MKDNEVSNEVLDALMELKSAVLELKATMLDARDSMAGVINNSHLRSTLTLLKQDVGFRRTLELIT